MPWPWEKEGTNPEAKPGEPKPGEPKPGEKVEVKPGDPPDIAKLIADSLKPFTESTTKMNERLDAIEQNTVRRPERTEPAERTSVFDDEDAAFSQRMTPVMMRQLEIEARMVYGDIKQEYVRAGYGDLIDQFAKDIETTLGGTNLVTQQQDPKTGAMNLVPLRGNPDYIRNTIDMIMGRAARKAGMRFDGKKNGFFLESTGTGDGATGGGSPEADGLTDAQRKVFNRMKVPMDDAKKVMSKLHFVS